MEISRYPQQMILSSPPPPSPADSYASANSPLAGPLTPQSGTLSSQDNSEKVKQYNNYTEICK